MTAPEKWKLKIYATLTSMRNLEILKYKLNMKVNTKFMYLELQSTDERNYRAHPKMAA